MDRKKLKIVMASLVAGPVVLNGGLALWGSIAYRLHGDAPAASGAAAPSPLPSELPPAAPAPSFQAPAVTEPLRPRPRAPEPSADVPASSIPAIQQTVPLTTPQEKRPPRSPELDAKFTLAKNLSTTGEYAAALRVVDDILTANPGNREAERLRSQIRTGLDNAVSAHAAKAADLYRLGLLPEALQECDRALALDPGNSAAATLRAKIARAIEILHGN